MLELLLLNSTGLRELELRSRIYLWKDEAEHIYCANITAPGTRSDCHMQKHQQIHTNSPLAVTHTQTHTHTE